MSRINPPMNFSLHGWFVIDKPYRISSASLVNKIKFKILETFYPHSKKLRLKVGHGGTLDPLATGLLPIALGEATKTVDFVMDAPKEYLFEVTWGESRTTDDKEGKILETCSRRPSLSEIEKVLPSFHGEILQTPPLYTALKINGERAYTRVRRGEIISPTPRTIMVHHLKILETQKDRATFSLRCGKGTYVRAVARDLAKTLETCGYVSSLRRTKVGFFDESHIISLDNLDRLGHKLGENFFSLDAVLDDIPAVTVCEKDAQALSQGQKVRFSLDLQTLSKRKDLLFVVKSHSQRFIGLAFYETPSMSLHLKRGFNLG